MGLVHAIIKKPRAIPRKAGASYLGVFQHNRLLDVIGCEQIHCENHRSGLTNPNTTWNMVPGFLGKYQK